MCWISLSCLKENIRSHAKCKDTQTPRPRSRRFWWERCWGATVLRGPCSVEAPTASTRLDEASLSDMASLLGPGQLCTPFYKWYLCTTSFTLCFSFPGLKTADPCLLYFLLFGTNALPRAGHTTCVPQTWDESGKGGSRQPLCVEEVCVGQYILQPWLQCKNRSLGGHVNFWTILQCQNAYQGKTAKEGATSHNYT